MQQPDSFSDDAGTVRARTAGHLADGRPVTEYTLEAGGLRLCCLDLGGIVTSLHAPDRAGRSDNVTVGLARLDDYLGTGANFGSLVGRFAGRIANGSFALDGETHFLARNEGSGTLHGGPSGFGLRLWTTRPLPATDAGDVGIEFALASPDGDQGFPGCLEVRARYTLTRTGEWRIDYHATTDRPTVVNLTHHAYWNLAGAGGIEDHHLELLASRYATLDERLIPQALEDVTGTPFDFHGGRRIGDRLRDTHPQMRLGRGYDHYFLLDRTRPGLAPAARLEHRASGRVLEIETTEPGLQLYTGNFLDGRLEARGRGLLRQGDALCLETQRIGDAPNRREAHEVILRPGEVHASTTVHRFSTLAHGAEPRA